MARRRSRNRPTAASPRRFRVSHKPTVTPSKGNWAVVQRSNGHIRSRHHTQAAAQQSAGIRGREVRRTRRSEGRAP